MKKIEKQKVNKKPETTESQFGVILEDINSKLDLLVEGHQSLNDGLEKFKDEMYEFRDEMYEFKDETGNNFKTVLGYLMKIDEEIVDIKSEISELKKSLSSKADLERIVNLELRVQKLELLLAQKR